MKNLMKIASILLLACLIIIIIGLNFEPGSTFAEIYSHILNLLLDGVIPIAVLGIGSLCAQRKEEGLTIHVVMAIALFSLIISALQIFLPLDDIGESFANFIKGAHSFMGSVNLYLLFFTLLRVIKPNNVIANTTQKVGYIAIIVNIIFQIWLYIKIEMVETLPNVYGYDGFNFSSIAESAQLVSKVYIISILVEIWAILLSYITNYAFEQDTIEADQMDYDELKKQVEVITQEKIDQIYRPPVVEEEPDRSASKMGLMNVNNQLGISSNVGQIQNPSTLPKTFVDRGIPTSSGPVVNNAVANSTNPANPATPGESQIKENPNTNPTNPYQSNQNL